MTDRLRRPGLAALDDALAARDVEAARESLLLLDAEERAILESEMGPGALAGAYRLAVGLYDPATGERLKTPDGADQVVLNLPVTVR